MGLVKFSISIVCGICAVSSGLTGIKHGINAWLPDGEKDKLKAQIILSENRINQLRNDSLELAYLVDSLRAYPLIHNVVVHDTVINNAPVKVIKKISVPQPIDSQKVVQQYIKNRVEEAKPKTRIGVKE